MGLLIKSTEETPITIQGTEIQIPEVYGRIEFAGRADGKKLEIAVGTYASKLAFKTGAGNLFTNVQQGTFNVEILETETQSIESAEKYAKEVYISLGYNVEII